MLSRRSRPFLAPLAKLARLSSASPKAWSFVFQPSAAKERSQRSAAKPPTADHLTRGWCPWAAHVRSARPARKPSDPARSVQTRPFGHVRSTDQAPRVRPAEQPMVEAASRSCLDFEKKFLKPKSIYKQDFSHSALVQLDDTGY